MEDQAAYITKEPAFTRTQVLEELRKVIAEKNQRHGFDDLFYQDHLAIQIVTDALANLNANYKKARATLCIQNL